MRTSKSVLGEEADVAKHGLFFYLSNEVNQGCSLY